MKAKTKVSLKNCVTCRLNCTNYCRECYTFDKYTPNTKMLEEFH